MEREKVRVENNTLYGWIHRPGEENEWFWGDDTILEQKYLSTDTVNAEWCANYINDIRRCHARNSTRRLEWLCQDKCHYWEVQAPIFKRFTDLVLKAISEGRCSDVPTCAKIAAHVEEIMYEGFEIPTSA